MKRLGNRLLVLVLAVPLVAFAIVQGVFFWGYLKSHRAPERFILPDGYVGWVVVEYADPGCPELPTREEFRVVSVPGSGIVCTSSPLPRGWAGDVFTYGGTSGINLLDNPSEGTNLIWHEHVMGFDDGAKRFYAFYVGDKMAKDVLQRERDALRRRIANQEGARAGR